MTVVANNVTASSVAKVCVFKPPILIPQQTPDVDGIDLANDRRCWFGVGYISGAGRAVDDLGDITMCADCCRYAGNGARVMR